MVDVREQTERLRMTKSILSEEYERMNLTNVTIQSTSEVLHKTNNKYNRKKWSCFIYFAFRVCELDGEGITIGEGDQDQVSAFVSSDLSKIERRRKSYGSKVLSMLS